MHILFQGTSVCILELLGNISTCLVRFMQEVHISKSVKLIDSPGVVALTSNPAASMALRSLQVEEGQESVLEAVRALLKQCDETQVRKAVIAREAGPAQHLAHLLSTPVASGCFRSCSSIMSQTSGTHWSF